MDLIDRAELIRRLFPTYAEGVIRTKDVYNAIMDAPTVCREIKPLCNDCIHYDVCYPRITTNDGTLLSVTSCAFYIKREEV